MALDTALKRWSFPGSTLPWRGRWPFPPDGVDSAATRYTRLGLYSGVTPRLSPGTRFRPDAPTTLLRPDRTR